MTPDRLEFLITACLQRRGKLSLTAHLQDIADFLKVRPRTLRRWINGTRPIPPTVEIIMEIFYARPDIDARFVHSLIAQRDADAA